MLRKGLILLVVSSTASLAVAQAQEPKNSTDTVFHGPHRETPQQQGQRQATQQHLGAWERMRVGRPGNIPRPVPIPLGEEYAVSITSLAAPKQARAAFDKAMREIDKGDSADLAKARQFLEKAVEEYPEYAAAFTKLGQVRADLGDPDGAIVALEKSVELDDRYLAPYDALVWLYMAKGNWDHATELTKFALNDNPADATMRWYQPGCANESGRDTEALALIGEIQNDAEAVKQFPQTPLFMGLIYARHGQRGQAAAAYRRYLELDPNAQAAEAVKKQLNEWQQLGVL